MGPVNYGEMSERQIAEFVADASKEAPEWMLQMQDHNQVKPPPSFSEILGTNQDEEFVILTPTGLEMVREFRIGKG